MLESANTPFNTRSSPTVITPSALASNKPSNSPEKSSTGVVEVTPEPDAIFRLTAMVEPSTWKTSAPTKPSCCAVAFRAMYLTALLEFPVGENSASARLALVMATPTAFSFSSNVSSASMIVSSELASACVKVLPSASVQEITPSPSKSVQ